MQIVPLRGVQVHRKVLGSFFKSIFIDIFNFHHEESEKVVQTVFINFFIIHNELKDFQKNLNDDDRLNLLCAYPALLSVISESYPHDNPDAANEGKDTETSRLTSTSDMRLESLNLL